jgi:hypothetical protein
MEVTTIGLDIAKSVFQIHGIDAEGNVIVRRQIKRRYVLAFFQKLPPCLVGIEACASSHHWSRELKTLGHKVRLIPPAYVKPYVKRQKNDAADAEAICEAVTRANMRFVETKTPEQQGCLMLHRTRHLFVRQQTAVINSIRAHLAEFGIVAPVGQGARYSIAVKRAIIDVPVAGRHDLAPRARAAAHAARENAREVTLIPETANQRGIDKRKLGCQHYPLGSLDSQVGKIFLRSHTGGFLEGAREMTGRESARQALACRERSRRWPCSELAYGKAASVGGLLRFGLWDDRRWADQFTPPTRTPQ